MLLWRLFGWVFLSGVAPAAPSETAAAVGWWVVSLPGIPAAQTAVETAREEFSKLAVRLVDTEELKMLLREQDRRRNLPGRAGGLLSRGRELHLGLKLKEAMDHYQQAIDTLEAGFARYYAPGLLAEPILQLGVAFFQSNQTDQARRAFMRAVAFAPALQLAEGYYSPSVREAFQLARDELGVVQPPGIPPPEELRRICAALKLAGVVVVSVERLGEGPVLRLALFDAGPARFCAAETILVEGNSAPAAGKELAGRLSGALARVAGIPLVPPPMKPDLEPSAKVPPKEPWYLRYWWVWPVAAAVVGVAVVLPLTVFRRDVVDVQVRY